MLMKDNQNLTQNRMTRMFGEPMGYVDGPNTYQFELSNPVDNVDPTGMEGVPTTQPKGLTPDQRTALRNLIGGYEGNDLTVYNDSKGIPTIGIGHNLQSDDGTCQNVTGKSAQDLIKNSGTLTQDQVNKLFDADLDKAVAELEKRFPNFDSLPPDVQATLIDLDFNLGGAGIGKFHDFCKDINNNDFSAAAWDLSHKTNDPNSPPSKYMGDVGQRAIDNVNRLQNSATPPMPTTRPLPTTQPVPTTQPAAH